MDDRFTYARAKSLVLQTGNGSISHLQRVLGITYQQGINLMDRFRQEGFVTGPDSKGRRIVLRHANDRS